MPLPIGAGGDAAVSDLPELLAVEDLGGGRYRAPQPELPVEGRGVVYSGQLLAQLLMASDRAGGGEKDVRSVHAVFARVGSTVAPIALQVEPLHAGRTWASDTVTATQGDRVLCRALVLANAIDPDLMRHGPVPPGGVPAPDEVVAAPGLVFPGAQWRPVPGERHAGGSPLAMAWHRYGRALPTPAANQAVLAWATCGEVIGLAMRPHRDTVRLADAHRTLSTGVIAQTVHFVERFDASRWLLVVTEGTKAASGRVLGGGRVFTEDGTLVATFEQDSMAKRAEGGQDAGRPL